MDSHTAVVDIKQDLRVFDVCDERLALPQLVWFATTMYCDHVPSNAVDLNTVDIQAVFGCIVACYNMDSGNKTMA